LLLVLDNRILVPRCIRRCCLCDSGYVDEGGSVEEGRMMRPIMLQRQGVMRGPFVGGGVLNDVGGGLDGGDAEDNGSWLE